MYCEKCGKQIPDDARLCSYCGVNIGEPVITAPVPAKKKKGCLMGCLGFFIIVILFGVVSNLLGLNHGANTDGAQTVTQKQVEKRAFKIGETFKSNAFELTITGKDITKRVNDKSGYLYSDANGVFVVVHVHYKNIANSAKSLDSSAFQLVVDGKQYSPTILTIRLNENIFHNQINPGIEKDGDVYFDVPENVANSNLALKLSSSFMSDNFNGEVQLY